MPSIAAHISCGNLVYKELKNQIKDKDQFLIGCILPDIINEENSHNKIKGKYYDIPDINYFKNTFNMESDLNKGYLCHLLLDKYFLEEYIPKEISTYDKEDIFLPNKIYQDYTNMNIDLVDKYNIDVNYISKIISKYNLNIRHEKYKSDLKNLRNTIKGPLTLLDLTKITTFIDTMSPIISEEISSIPNKKGATPRS